MKINEKIRQLREQHQLSQENMADRLGMSVTGYAKIERGEVRSNLPRLEQISEVFDMDICELLSYGESEKVYFNNSVTESTNSNNFLFAVGNDNLEKAIEAAYKNVKEISFKDNYYRKDIGTLYVPVKY